jgi:DUF4097 and DUF4098 domain-containing protein YvlB
MRRRSVTGPLMLLLIGSLFLWRNLHPEWPIFDTLARFWPFILIIWGTLRLVEVLFSRKRGYTTFTGGEVALIVLICIAGSAVWQARQHGIRFNAGGLDVFGEQYDYPVSAKAPATGMTRITFENQRGNLKIFGSDTQEVTVSGRKVIRAWARRDADQSDANTPVEIIPQGDRLLIRTNQDRVPDSQRISNDLEVSVPRGMFVEARGRSGDMEITDITGNVELASSRSDVRLARVGGDIRLDIGRSELIRALDIKGKVDLQGRGSEVDFENIAGQVTINGTFTGTLQFKALAKPLQFEGARNTEVRVQAVPGRISMDLGEFSGSGLVGPVRLVTRSRDIKLDRFTHSLEIETERGDITLQPSLPIASIEARSGAGRIDLILPEKATFDLQATAEKGEAHNDFGPQIRQERDGRTSTLKGKVGEGPNIRLTANRGAVTVRKEGSLPSNLPSEAEEPEKRLPKDLKRSEMKM